MGIDGVDCRRPYLTPGDPGDRNVHFDYAESLANRKRPIPWKVVGVSVVSVLDDAYAEDGAPYLVMELLEGYSLERHPQSPANALPLRQVLKIADELLEVRRRRMPRGSFIATSSRRTCS